MKIARQQPKLALKSVTEALMELGSDSAVPRNVKDRVQKILLVLSEEGEMPLKADRAIQELDEIGNDVNLQPYTRTQIWNVVSLLEKV